MTTTSDLALHCPRCEVPLDEGGRCADCGLEPQRIDGLLDFLGGDRVPVPEPAVNAFYEARPFPGYDDGDDATTLLDRCRTSPFLVALDEATPPDASVLDAGCGTGQIANFMALAGRRRRVYGVDACHASLDAAETFRARAGADNLTLLRGSLFCIPLPEDAFDVVNCRGVVHHTPEPYEATRRVARHVKPGGYLVLSFYESIARLPHHVRQRTSRLIGRPVRALDPLLRRRDLTEDKKQTWIEDQYHHPLEASLPFPAVLAAVKDAGFQFLRSIPPAPGRASLFDETPEPGALGLFLRRLGWALELKDEDAGCVCLVARRGR